MPVAERVEADRADVDGPAGRGHRHEVHVVVVEPRQQGAAAGIDVDVGARRHRAEVGDDAIVAAHVDAPTVDVGVAQQQRRRCGQASTGTSAIAAAISSSGSS